MIFDLVLKLLLVLLELLLVLLGFLDELTATQGGAVVDGLVDAVLVVAAIIASSSLLAAGLLRLAAGLNT